MSFQMPPVVRGASGDKRTVGFELEFAGVEIDTVADLLADLFDGHHTEENRFVHRVGGGRYGEFTVELDSSVLKDKTYEKHLRGVGINLHEMAIRPGVEDLLARVASAMVPIEIVTPPLPIDELNAVERIREALYQRHARGTDSNVFYAFGLHINPDVPGADVTTILRLLRAYILLHDWIVRRTRPDLSRRVTPFINRFPDEYTEMVAGPSYEPDMQRMIDDYLEHNPTRNRALDLLPLLAWVDRDRVLAAADEPKLIKPRPTAHYRLPNCRVDDPEWSVAEEWNLWVEVERLAANPDKLARMAEVYLKERRFPQKLFRDRWTDRVEAWIP